MTGGFLSLLKGRRKRHGQGEIRTEHYKHYHKYYHLSTTNECNLNRVGRSKRNRAVRTQLSGACAFEWVW